MSVTWSSGDTTLVLASTKIFVGWPKLSMSRLFGSLIAGRVVPADYSTYLALPDGMPAIIAAEAKDVTASAERDYGVAISREADTQGPVVDLAGTTARRGDGHTPPLGPAGSAREPTT